MAKNADVVKAVQVVGVAVGQQNSVKGGEFCGQRLAPKVGAHVNKDAPGLSFKFVFQKRAGPVALVAAVGGTAHGAVAGDYRNSVACSAS